jgi:RNA polymerase sigma-70 factor (ECF subfamily)
VWRACAALVDHAAADDLTQDTFLRAVRSLPGYRGDATPMRWLLTIARRVCAEEIARRQRARATVTRLKVASPCEHYEPMGLSELADGLNQLSSERREAFVLTAIAGLSYAEAAAVCGCPIGTIRSRVARARTQLIDSLTRGDVEAPMSEAELA